MLLLVSKRRLLENLGRAILKRTCASQCVFFNGEKASGLTWHGRFRLGVYRGDKNVARLNSRFRNYANIVGAKSHR